MHVYNLNPSDTINEIAKLKKAREDNGDVFGGGKGVAGDRYVMAHCANANNTVVNINIESDATAEN